MRSVRHWVGGWWWAAALGASSTVTGGAFGAGPAAVDPAVVRAVAEARGAHGGVAGYVALRRLWKRWDQTDPAPVEEAFHLIADDTSVGAPLRTYASLLGAYARRRRGDVDGAKKRIHELGYLDQWLVVGPFDNEAKASLDTPFGPEEDTGGALATGRTYEGKERQVAWRALPPVFDSGYIDFGSIVRPSEKICAYATTFVRARPVVPPGAHPGDETPAAEASRERAATVWVGASGSFRVYWDGAEVLSDGAYRALDPDRLAARVVVKPGWNRLTVKVCGDEEGAMLQARLADAKGAPDASLEAVADPTLGEQAAKNAKPPAKAVEAEAAEGVRVRPAKGSPSVRGATGPAGRHRSPPAAGGPLAGLAALAAQKGAGSPAALETMARYLASTGGDDKNQHLARDFAQRAAEAQPTVERLILAAEVAEDFNARAVWLGRAREHVRPGQDDSDLLLSEALHARSGVNPREAVPYFDRLLARDPGNVPALLGRVELYADAGLRYSALATLEQAAAREPNSVAILRALAHELRVVGRVSDADDVERRYASLRFDDASFLRSKVELAVARRDRQAGDRWADRLLSIEPESFATTEFVARSLRALGETPRAVSLLRRRLDLAPDDVEAMHALADLYGEDGHADEQLKLLRHILVVRPQAKDVREYVEHVQPEKARRDEAYAWEKDKILVASRAIAPPGFPKRTLRDLQVTTVYPNGLASRFHQVVFQPLTEEAAAAGRQYAFGFESGRDVVDMRAARVYRQSGKVDEAVETGEGPADNPELAMYSSARTYYIQLPRLEPGDVVELRYRVEEVTPRNEFGDTFSETAYLQSSEPIASSEYVLIAPKARKMHLRLPTQFAVTREEKDDGDSHVYRVAAQAVPPVLGEPFMPPLPEVGGSLSVSTFSSWDEVGRWYWGLSKDQFDADDDVRRLVRELTKGLTTTRDKVRAVYDYVVQRTRYVALEFGIEGFRPRRCAQTLSRGWGDCKDKATVIVTMLRELGIGANIVLVRTGMRGDTPTDPPSYALFDHAIAYVPELDLYLDGTAEYTGMNELPAMDRGAVALQVAEGGKAKLVRLPVPPADQTTRVRKVDLTLAERGEAQLDLRVETTGALAAELRQRYHAKATQRARVVGDVGREFGGLTLPDNNHGLEVGDLEDIEQPVKLHLNGKALGVVKSAAGEFSLDPSPVTSLVARYAPLSGGRFAIKLPFAITYDDEWVIHTPAGYAQRQAPPVKTVQSPFGRLEVQTEAAPGKLTVRTRLRLEQTRIAPSDYVAFRDFCQQVDRVLGERVILGK